MGSRRNQDVRRRVERDTVSLTKHAVSLEIEDIAGHAAESIRSSRAANGRDTAATNTNDAIEWLTRVLRCALYGQHGDTSEALPGAV
jgi:hypothetical protein